MMKVGHDKVIWIKIDSSEDREDVQNFILSLRQEGLSGEISVILYAQQEDSRAILSHVYSLSEEAIPLLAERYGSDNVCLEAKVRTQSLHFSPVPDPLGRIADALESISSTLDSIEQSLDLLSNVLSDCHVEGKYGNAIAVAGVIQIP